MPKMIFDDRANMRAEEDVRRAAAKTPPNMSGPDVGGRDSPRVSHEIKQGKGKAAVETSGPVVGGTTNPGAKIKRGRGK